MDDFDGVTPEVAFEMPSLGRQGSHSWTPHFLTSLPHPQEALPVSKSPVGSWTAVVTGAWQGH